MLPNTLSRHTRSQADQRMCRRSGNPHRGLLRRTQQRSQPSHRATGTSLSRHDEALPPPLATF